MARGWMTRARSMVRRSAGWWLVPRVHRAVVVVQYHTGPVSGALHAQVIRRWVYLAASIMFLAFAYDLTRLPVQVHDSLGDIQDVRLASSVWGAFLAPLHQEGYLRPLKAAQIRLVFDLSRGHYAFAYRAVHLLLFGLTVWAFTWVMRVRTWADAAAAGFALTVLLGLHTFSNLLREAYPINHFLEIVLFSLVALGLAQSAPRPRNDVLVLVLFIAGALVVESGLLIWVVVVAARLSGMKGISLRGIALLTLLLGAYLGLRFLVFSNGIPLITERSTGYFFRVLEQDDQVRLFGSRTWPLYAYNIAASMLSVLFSEPRAGQLVATAQLLDGRVQPWTIVALASSLATTLLVLVAAVHASRSRSARDDGDRLFVVFGIVLVANAVLSFAYAKGDIVSVAGAFYALAAYAAVRRILAVGVTGSLVSAAVVFGLLVVASTGWALRTTGLHYSLRYQAFKVRNDWVSDVDAKWLEEPGARAVSEQLRRAAVEKRVLAPRFYPRWEERWFEE